MSETSDWLDTETRAQLSASPPDKLAPPQVGHYSLILLESGPDETRVERALRRVAEDHAYSPSSTPCIVRRGLSLTDALQGQFEFICADSISIFLDDAVVQSAKLYYLTKLFRSCQGSPEFETIIVSVLSIPDDNEGKRFMYQFFGEIIEVPRVLFMFRKKARIMQHWGLKLGANIEVDDI